MTDQTKAAAPLLRPLITTAGLAAAVQASTLGKKCEITHIGLSATPGTAAVGDKTLPGEAFRVPVADGRVINEYQVNVSGLIMDTHPSLSIHGIGFYLSDGTLFALHRETSPFLNHTAGTTLLVGMDMVMNNIPSDVIHVESTGANLILGDFVPLNRRVNNKVLDKDITLNAADVGALSTAGGGTVTGPVRIMHASGLRVETAEGVGGFRLVESGGNQYLQAGASDGDEAKQKLIMSGWMGKNLSFLRFAMADGAHPYVRQGGVDYRMYHQGNKPTAADVGALDSAKGGTVKGRVTIEAPASHLNLIETDANNKGWRLEGADGNVRIVENDVAVRATFKEGGGVELSGDVKATGEFKSAAGSNFRMSGGNVGAFWYKDTGRHYLMLTDSGKAETGTFNALRPFAVDLPTGFVTLGEGALVKKGLEVQSGALTMTTNYVKGARDSIFLRDHGNGNASISAGLNDKGEAGDLYLGYQAAATGSAGFNTRSVRMGVPLNWNAAYSLINADGLLNSERMYGPIRTEKDDTNTYHTIVGGADTVNRGRTIVAAGEAGKKVYDNTTTGAEDLHCAADGTIFLHTRVQNDWADRRTVKITDGELYAVDGTKRVLRDGFAYGLGAKQGDVNDAKDFTEDKTRDFNKLLTAGTFGLTGLWLNATDNKGTELSMTAIVEVMVRPWPSGPAYVQRVHLGLQTSGVRYAERTGNGTYPNIVWSKWAEGGTYQNNLEYRLTIERPGDAAYPYLTMSKPELRTGFAANAAYTVGNMQFKVGEKSDQNNPDSGQLAALVQGNMFGDNTMGELYLASRNIVTGGTTCIARLSHNGFTTTHASKSLNWKDGILLADNQRVYTQGFKPTAADVAAIPTTGKMLAAIQLGFRSMNYADDTTLRDMSFSGFYRPNGQSLNDLKLPNLMMHCAHPTYGEGKHSRGIGFGYGGSNWDLSTTAFDKDGVYLGQSMIYHEKNKPTAADVEALSLKGGKIVGKVEATDVEARLTHSLGYMVQKPYGSTYDDGTMIRSYYRAHDSGKPGQGWAGLKFDKFTPAVGDAPSVSEGFDMQLGNNFVYHQGRKPTFTDVGSYSIAQVDTKLDKQTPATSGKLIGNQNLNDYQTPGYYFQDSNANASSGANYPTNQAGSLTVEKAAGIVQTYKVFNGSVVYRRACYEGKWSAWSKDYNSLNKPTPAEINAVSTKGGSIVEGGVTHFRGTHGPVVLQSTLAGNNNPLYLLGNDKDGVSRWYVGQGGDNGDVVLHGYGHNTTLSLKSDHVLASRTLRDNSGTTFTTGRLPTAEQSTSNVRQGDPYAIGAYMLAALAPNAGQCTPGVFVQGANLRPAACAEYSYAASSLPGTWMCMGDISGSNQDDRLDDRTTVWIRSS